MKKKTLFRLLALVNVISGIVILVYVLAPIVSYELTSSPNFDTEGISPIPEEKVDYTKASNWFEGTSKENFINGNIQFYTLSIPKLKIDNATVAIGGEDLSDNLIQYPGTALPGKRGNAVIFGHSILPQFYNPKDYLAIFSTLPSLKKGDEININYDGISYLYRVEDMFEVTPGDLEVLEQNSSDSFVTLVTCTPPGDPRKPRRLIVRARVVPLEGVGDASIRH